MSVTPKTRTARGLNMVLPQVSAASDPVVGAELTGLMQANAALARQYAKDFKIIAKFTETMTPGDAANLYSDAGVIAARRADATAGLAKLCNGFVTIAASAGSEGEVTVMGLNEFLASLVPGTLYYLGTTPGTITATPATTSGYAKQPVGFATTTDSVLFQPALTSALNP